MRKGLSGVRAVQVLLGLLVVVVAAGFWTSKEPDTDRSAESASFGWESCGDIECGFLEVPVDYDAPDGDMLKVAVARAPVTGPDRLGVLVLQAGGPGASSIELVQRFAGATEGPTARMRKMFKGAGPIAELREVYDFVAVESRGIGASEPKFACGVPGTYRYQELVSQLGVSSTGSAATESGEAAVQLCVESMGEAAAHLGTVSHVRDIDAVRQALAEGQISYLGFSYGSEVGGWYASMFPERVRSIVVDGAASPVKESQGFEVLVEAARQEIRPVEVRLRAMLEACDDVNCPIYNDGDPIGFYYRAIEKGHLIDESMRVSGAQIAAIYEPLYDEARWPAFYSALAVLEQGNPKPMVTIAEGQYLGLDPAEVNYPGYVSCLDSWALKPELDRQARIDLESELEASIELLDSEFPLLRTLERGVHRGNPCPFMDTLNPPLFETEFDGGGVPVLVVGNKSDPATSLSDSAEMAEQLIGGVLIEADHPSHVIFPENDCVNDLVLDALIHIKYPTETAICERVK